MIGIVIIALGATAIFIICLTVLIGELVVAYKNSKLGRVEIFFDVMLIILIIGGILASIGI